jgi:hypothetical protein
MKRFTLLLATLLIASTMALAQSVPATFAWDASTDGPGPVTNPIKYRLYVSTTLPVGGGIPTGAVQNDAGIALEKAVSFASGTFYVFATAYCNALTVDGIPVVGSIVESGLSNILKVDVRIPPGNPRNAKFKVTNVAQSTTGQGIIYRRRG